MNKEYIVNNKICFLVKDYKESEYIQNYLFSLGCNWSSHNWSSHKYNQIINFSNYPKIIFVDKNLDLSKKKHEYKYDMSHSDKDYGGIKGYNSLMLGLSIIKVNQMLRKYKLNRLNNHHFTLSDQ